MNTKTEGAIEILAAFLVLMSAMMDPRISVMLAVVGLLALGIYKWVQKKPTG